MTIISQPSAMRLVHAEWTRDYPAQVNRSQWTGRDQVIANPWHTRMSAQAEFAPIVGEANIRPWRAFLAKLKGQINTFRLIAVENAQTGVLTVTVNGAHAAGVSSVSAAGFPVSTTAMTAGMMIALNDQLCILTADVTSNGSGIGTLTLDAPLRAAASNGTAIEVRYPTCLVAMTDSAFRWSADKGQIYGISLALEERY